MSFFTNPFADPSAPPLSATISAGSSSLPIPASLRRSSRARVATPGSSTDSSPSNLPPTAALSTSGPAGGPVSPLAQPAGGAMAAAPPPGGITFVSPFAASNQKRGSIAHSTITITPGRRPSTPGSPARPGTGRSSSLTRSASGEHSPVLPASRRASVQGTSSPLCSPSAGTSAAAPFFSNWTAGALSSGGLLKVTPDFTRRRSVDVGVLGVGTHRLYGVTAMSRRVRDAVGPDAGDKETGVVGAGGKGRKDRLCVSHFPSLALPRSCAARC